MRPTAVTLQHAFCSVQERNTAAGASVLLVDWKSTVVPGQSLPLHDITVALQGFPRKLGLGPRSQQKLELSWRDVQRMSSGSAFVTPQVLSFARVA